MQDTRPIRYHASSTLLGLVLSPVLGLSLMHQGAAQQTAVSTEELESQLVQTTGMRQLEVLVELTHAHRRDRPAEAAAFGKRALAMLPAYPDEDLELSLLNGLSYAIIRTRAGSEYEEGLRLAERAEALAKTIGDDHSLAFAYRNIGRAHRYLLDYDLALQYFERSIELYGSVGDPSGLGDVLTYTGHVYRQLGDYELTLSFYLRAYQEYETGADQRGLGVILENIGQVYVRLGRPEEAFKFYEEALDVHRKGGHDRATAMVLGSLGALWREQGRPERALELFRESLRAYDEVGEKNPDTPYYLGLVYHDLGDTERALEAFRRSREIQARRGSERGVADSLLRIAAIRIELGETEKAIDTLREALTNAEASRSKETVADVQRLLSESLAAQGNYLEALESFRRFEAINAEVLEDRSQLGVAEMQARFDVERNRRAVELLERESAVASLQLQRQQILVVALLIGLGLLAATMLFRVRAERKVRESEQRYRQLFDDPASAKLLVDAEDGRIVDANNSSRALLAGVGSQEEASHASGPEWLRDIMTRLQGEKIGGSSFVETVQPEHDDGRELEAWVSPMRVAGRHAALVTVQDVTERRRLEEERIRRAERERYIHEIESKNTELESKNAELERYAYTVSHDLKAPLVTIQGFVGLLAQDIQSEDPERVRHDIDVIGGAADQMSELLNDLLELSRVGRVVNPSETISLTELAKKAVRMFEAEITKSGIEVEIQPDMPEVWCDSVRLFEIMQNLVENAIKFRGDQKEPRITIGGRVEANEVICHVQDNGIGIDHDYLERIFKLFERLDTHVPGTGLGLALVRRIVEFHGGRVWAESPGQRQGTTLTFALPRSDPSQLG